MERGRSRHTVVSINEAFQTNELRGHGQPTYSCWFIQEGRVTMVTAKKKTPSVAGGSPPLSTSRHSRPVGRGCLFRSASGALLCQPWESESINISLEYGNQSTVAPWSVFIFLFLSFYYYYFHFVVSGRRRPFPGVAVRFSAPLGTTAGQLSARLITRNNGRRAGME